MRTGRPKKNLDPLKPLTLRLKEDIHRDLKDICYNKKTVINNEVEKLIIKFIKANEKFLNRKKDEA